MHRAHKSIKEIRRNVKGTSAHPKAKIYYITKSVKAIYFML